MIRSVSVELNHLTYINSLTSYSGQIFFYKRDYIIFLLKFFLKDLTLLLRKISTKYLSLYTNNYSILLLKICLERKRVFWEEINSSHFLRRRTYYLYAYLLDFCSFLETFLNSTVYI